MTTTAGRDVKYIAVQKAQKKGL